MEKCPGFQSRLCEFLTAVIRIVLVVIEESIDNRQGGGSKSAVPFTNVLIDLDKGLIRLILGRRM